MKTPKTETSSRKVYIPSYVGKCLKELNAEQDHTSVTYKLKLSGGDIKAVHGDSGHAQADMVTEVYGHILDVDRKKNAQHMENAFYNKENLNPDIYGTSGPQNNKNNNMICVPEGVDADMLMKVLGNPEMAALLTSLAKSMKG